MEVKILKTKILRKVMGFIKNLKEYMHGFKQFLDTPDIEEDGNIEEVARRDELDTNDTNEILASLKRIEKMSNKVQSSRIEHKIELKDVPEVKGSNSSKAGKGKKLEVEKIAVNEEKAMKDAEKKQSQKENDEQEHSL